MAIQQTKKTSDLEKRLRLLRQQVYGKNSGDQYISRSIDQKRQTSDMPAHRYTDTLISSDITYLYKDLSKITLLSTLAIAIQLFLFFLSKNHFLNSYLK